MKIEYDDDKIERRKIFMINKFKNAGVKVEGYENYKYTIEYLVLDCYGSKYKFPIKRDYDE